MLKIVYIVPIIAPYTIPRYQELAKNKNIEVHVIAELNTNSERVGWHFQKIDGIKTYLMKSKITKNFEIQNKTNGYKMKKSRVISTELRKKIKEINPDIVLACNSTQIMLLLGQRRKYKLGVIVEDTLRAAEARTKINSFFKKLMLKKADFYCPFSEDAKKFLKFNGIDQPYIETTWSMDVDFFRDLSQSELEKKRKDYGMDDKKNNYIIVSGLIPRKGIIEFLDAWKSMSIDFHKKSELFLIGDGELRNEIFNKIKDEKYKNVHLEGNKDYKNVSHYLQCGDIFVLPTLEDLCSLSVLEAMAAKKPVLTTIYNGARQFVVEGVNGFIFDSMDKENIKSVLEKITQADIKEMSLASEMIINKYSTKKVMKKFEDDLFSYMDYK